MTRPRGRVKRPPKRAKVAGSTTGSPSALMQYVQRRMLDNMKASTPFRNITRVGFDSGASVTLDRKGITTTAGRSRNASDIIGKVIRSNMDGTVDVLLRGGDPELLGKMAYGLGGRNVAMHRDHQNFDHFDGAVTQVLGDPEYEVQGVKPRMVDNLPIDRSQARR